jgi:mono/diheme cytochrome c family protein
MTRRTYRWAAAPLLVFLMPSFGDMLSAEQIRAVAEFVATNAGSP